MTKSKSVEEQSKKKVAKRVITPKRRYFIPEQGRSVEAESLRHATGREVTKSKKEDGDGNK